MSIAARFKKSLETVASTVPWRACDRPEQAASDGRGSGQPLEQARCPTGVPEHDWTGQASIANSSHDPSQRLGRVDRVDQDPLGPRKEPRGLVGGSRRPTIAVAELIVLEHDLFRSDSDAGQWRQ